MAASRAAGKVLMLPAFDAKARNWWRDRGRTHPWVYPQDLEQQVHFVDDLSALPKGWELGATVFTNTFASGAEASEYTAQDGNITRAVVGGELQMSLSGASTYVWKSFATVPNTAYLVVFSARAGTNCSAVNVSAVNGGGGGSGTALGSTVGSVLTRTNAGFTFVATSTTTSIRLSATVSPTPGTAFFDNVTITSLVRDESWLGPELVSVGDFSSNSWWILNADAGATATIAGGKLTVVSPSGQAAGAYKPILTIGRSYRVKVDITVRSGSVKVDLGNATNVFSVSGSYEFTSRCATDTNLYLWRNTACDADFDNISVREIPGNPLVSPSAGNGPTATARVNALQRTQEFDHAAWNKGTGGSISANSVMAPDGSMTADAYTWPTSSGTFAYLSQAAAGLSQIPHRFSIWLKVPAGVGSRQLRLVVTDATLSTAQSPNVTVTESWQLFTFTRTSPNSTGQVGVGLFLPSGGPANGIVAGEVVHVWGADIRPTVYDSLNLPAYQWVRDGSPGVFDYDHIGFPVWLDRGAANRGLMTLGLLDLTSTDALNAGMVALKTSDAANEVLMETSANSNAGSGALLLSNATLVVGSATAGWGGRSRGTAPSSTNTTGSPAPHIAALLLTTKISTDALSLVVNAVAAMPSSTDQGAGNYGLHRAHMAVRSADASPSLSFSGRWLPGFIADANAVDATLAAELLREIAATVGHTY